MTLFDRIRKILKIKSPSKEWTMVRIDPMCEKCIRYSLTQEPDCVRCEYYRKGLRVNDIRIKESKDEY